MVRAKDVLYLAGGRCRGPRCHRRAGDRQARPRAARDLRGPERTERERALVLRRPGRAPHAEHQRATRGAELRARGRGCGRSPRHRLREDQAQRRVHGHREAERGLRAVTGEVQLRLQRPHAAREGIRIVPDDRQVQRRRQPHVHLESQSRGRRPATRSPANSPRGRRAATRARIRRTATGCRSTSRPTARRCATCSSPSSASAARLVARGCRTTS